jgi:hypothetical protein
MSGRCVSVWAATARRACPAVGDDTGCAILIVLNDNGAQILTDPSQGPFDGVEDTLIGVLNNTTSTTVTSVPVSGTSAVFDFDGDGICDNPNSTSGLAGADCSANTVDTTTYGGPDSHFTNINGAGTSGTVNFNNPLGPGQSTFFSLEGAISGSAINIVSGTSVPVAAVEGNAFSGTVADFGTTDTSTSASQYSASIDWGDGSAATSGTVSGGGGSFVVSGSHTYADENDASDVTVTITDTSNGNTTTVQSPVTVSDAILTASVASLSGTEGQSLGTVTVASFTDGNPLATTADFTSGGGSVTINWGDGATSTGTVAQTGTGQFSVSGSHSYAALGPYTITVKIIDDGGSMASATTKVTVFAFPAGGDFVIGDGNDAIGTPVTFWGAQWAKDDTLSGGSAPSAFKGFETSLRSPGCPANWTTAPGNSPPPPSGPLPSYMGVIVSSSITQSGSTIAGNMVHVAIVKTDPGYAPDPGHAGTGTVVALVC